MTSKEKLDSLVFECAFSEYDNIDEFIELHIKQSSNYKEIYQDLDRLEKLEKAFKIICEELEINVVDIEGDYKLIAAWCCSDISKSKGRLLREVLQDVKD